MRRIREALRLHLQAGLSYSEVGRALKISKSAVGKYVSLAKVAGVDCAVADGLGGRWAGVSPVQPSGATSQPPTGLIEKILTHLGLQARAPPRAPARGSRRQAA